MISPTVITQDFPCSGIPEWAVANAGIVATDISSGIKWEQKQIPKGNKWVKISSNNIYSPSSSGDVVGPGSATNNNFAAFDGITGKLIKDSGSNASSFQVALGFTPEDVANKSTNVVTDQASNTKYPSVKAVYDWGVATFATIASLASYLTIAAAAATYQVILTAANFGAFIVALTGKTTPVDADTIVISDSADSNNAKKVTLTNVKAFLKTYFDTIYAVFVESVTAESNIPVKVDNTDPTNPVLDYQWLESTETADFTLDITQAWTIIACETTGLLTVTVPDNATEAFPIGTQIALWGSDTGSVSIAPDGGVTINSRDGYLGIDGQFGKVWLTKTDTDVWLLDGDLDVALDPDAHAYIDAVGTFTDAEKGYINTWFVNAKANGYYSKYHAVYLFLGGTAASNKWNAVDPQNTDAAFRMVFTGSPTHNANGVTFNGTTQYGSTKLVPSAVLGQDSKHYSCYIRSAGSGWDWGALSAAFKGDSCATNYAGSQYQSISKTSQVQAPAGTRTRLWQHNRDTSTNCTLKRDGTTLVTDAGATDTNVGVEIVLAARNSNGTINLHTASNVCFFAIGDEFTSGEETSEKADVDALQLAFGRNV